mgnify:CR=1 FL=1
MITAIVLITADVDRIPEVAQEIADLDGVTEVYSVAGDADLIAMVRVRRHEDLADTIADRVRALSDTAGTPVLTRARHRAALEAAARCQVAVGENIDPQQQDHGCQQLAAGGQQFAHRDRGAPTAGVSRARPLICPGLRPLFSPRT